MADLFRRVAACGDDDFTFFVPALTFCELRRQPRVKLVIRKKRAVAGIGEPFD